MGVGQKIGMVVYGSIIVAFTGCDANIAARVTSMGDMTGMVFLLPESVLTTLSVIAAKT